MVMQRYFLTTCLLLSFPLGIKAQNNVPVMARTNGALRSPTNFFLTNITTAGGLTMWIADTNGRVVLSNSLMGGVSGNPLQITILNGTNINISSGAFVTNIVTFGGATNNGPVTNASWMITTGPNTNSGAFLQVGSQSNVVDLSITGPFAVYGGATNRSTSRNMGNVTNDSITHLGGNVVLNGGFASRIVTTDASKNLTSTAQSSGQLPIGNGSGGFTIANISNGVNIDVANGSGSITLNFNGNALKGTNVQMWPTAGSGTVVPLSIIVPTPGAVQTADLTQWITNGAAGTVVAGVKTDGTIYSFAGLAFTRASGSNMVLFSNSTTTNAPLIINLALGHNTNALSILDSAGNIMGYVSSNGVYRTTNDVFATFQSTDNTTNIAYSFTMRDNSVCRIVMDIVGYNATSSASYGKYATFKSVAGTVTQVGATSTLSSAEDDAVYESLLDTSANVIRVRVAGNTAKTVNWTVSGKILYSQ